MGFTSVLFLLVLLPCVIVQLTYGQESGEDGPVQCQPGQSCKQVSYDSFADGPPSMANAEGNRRRGGRRGRPSGNRGGQRPSRGGNRGGRRPSRGGNRGGRRPSRGGNRGGRRPSRGGNRGGRRSSRRGGNRGGRPAGRRGGQPTGRRGGRPGGRKPPTGGRKPPTSGVRRGGNAGGTRGSKKTGGGPKTGENDEPFCTEAEFKAAVTTLGFPSPSSQHYKNAVGQARSAGSITTKREFAMFLTQVIWESGGFKYKEEIKCKQTKCPGDYRTPGKDCPGKFYYGRGYIQLTWHENYRKASQALLGNDKLVCNPDLVAQDESLAWGTAFFYWKDRVHNFPGVQQGKFGATTKSINGGHECTGGAYVHKGRKRFQNYKKVLKALNINEPAIESGCYN